MTILPHIAHILDAARSAPSRDNLQPWRFVVEGDTVSFLVDAERDRAPMNAGDRMARMAVGAAVESALVRAGRMGATVRFRTPIAPALVTITFSNPKRTPEPDKALVRRATNRRPYDGRPLDDMTMAALREACPAVDLARTHWFGRERVRTLAPIIEEGEILYFREPNVRDAALGAMRFDARDREEVPHGVSLGSLELSGPERVALDAFRRTPQDRLEALGAFRKMGAAARKLMESASGVCVITARGDEPASDVNVGRSLQRAWLALTRQGMVAQPMTAIPALEALLERDPASLSGDLAAISAVVGGLRGAFPGVERGSRIAFLMRFGWAVAPTSRAGRRPLDESVAIARAADSEPPQSDEEVASGPGASSGAEREPMSAEA
jgi:nitroreductase